MSCDDDDRDDRDDDAMAMMGDLHFAAFVSSSKPRHRHRHRHHHHCECGHEFDCPRGIIG